MESVQVISLSATVSNAEEFGEWLGEVRGETHVILSEHRPIPLVSTYFDQLISNRLVLKPWQSEPRNPWPLSAKQCAR